MVSDRYLMVRQMGQQKEEKIAENLESRGRQVERKGINLN